jgi:hypothetical protein
VGKKSSSTIYYEYYISLSYGMCYGVADELVQVWFKEKEAVTYAQRLTTSGSIQINLPDLFGGFEREGGIVGTLEYYRGDSTQVFSPEMAANMHVDSANSPGYRDLTHIYLRGDENSGREGMSVSCMSPNVPAMWTRLRRVPKTLPGNVNSIVHEAEKEEDTRINANPAAIIHECVIDDQWGMGGDPVDLDAASWAYAAGVLHDEKFGLSMKWTQQMPIEDFCKEVLDHINGMVYFNPYTGKTVLKLIRDDYDRDTLNTYGPDQCELTSFKRKLWGETTNEITVQWTDPVKIEEQASVTFQDPGNIAMQDGDVVSKTSNYYGIRDEDLAVFVCQRDLQVEAAPLAAISFKVDRTQWKEMPGDCIKFRWPAYGITETILRVLDIDWGTVDNSKITVNLVEDIFSFQDAEFEPPGGPKVEDPTQDPNGPGFDELPHRFFAAPYTLLQQDFGDDAEEYLVEENYPRIAIGIMVWPTPGVYNEDGQLLSGTPDLQSFYAWKPTVTTTGEVTQESIGEKQLTGKATLKGPLFQEVRSTIFWENFVGGEPAEIGRYAIIGPEDDRKAEWVLIESRNPDGSYVLRRGVLDTVPHVWPQGTEIFFITTSFDAYDLQDPLAFVQQNYRLQARTSRGIADLANATSAQTTKVDRPYLPYRPANVKIENVMFGVVDEDQEDFLTDPSNPDSEKYDTWEPRNHWVFNVTWSRRHRMMEETVVFPWDGPDILPEDGQTTEIIVYRGMSDDAPEFTRITGLTGTSAQFDIIANTGQMEDFCLKFVSRRDGLESLQGIVIQMRLYEKGYGSDWGYVYGGWPTGPGLSYIEGEIELPGIEIEGEGTVGP